MCTLKVHVALWFRAILGMCILVWKTLWNGISFLVRHLFNLHHINFCFEKVAPPPPPIFCSLMFLFQITIRIWKTIFLLKVVKSPKRSPSSLISILYWISPTFSLNFPSSDLWKTSNSSSALSRVMSCIWRDVKSWKKVEMKCDSLSALGENGVQNGGWGEGGG